MVAYRGINTHRTSSVLSTPSSCYRPEIRNAEWFNSKRSRLVEIQNPRRLLSEIFFDILKPPLPITAVRFELPSLGFVRRLRARKVQISLQVGRFPKLGSDAPLLILENFLNCLGFNP